MRTARSTVAVVAAVAMCATAVVASSAGAAGGGGGTTSKKAGKTDETVQSLAVIEATGGEWNADTGGLTLTGVASKGVEFTDRPARKARSSSLIEILGTFFTDQAPPNAALEYEVTDANSQVAVVELTNPAYDPDQATLGFDARLLEDPESDLKEGSALTDFVLRQDGEPPPSFGATTLFLDSTAGPRKLTRGDATEQGEDGDQYFFVFEGDVTQDESSVILDVSCDFRSAGHGKLNYVARKPESPEKSIFDEPRFDVVQDAGGPVTIDATNLENYEFGSAFARSAWIVVRRGPAFVPDFDPNPHHYKVKIWCSPNQEGGWLVAH